MPARRVTRRTFLARTSSGAAVLGTSAWVARAAAGANDRLSVGIIGTGERGSAHMNQISGLAKAHNVQITAVCDVWKVNLDGAAAGVEKSFGRPPRKFTRFAELLALPDVDAVVIATPDFAHTPIMIEALKAGKDVYVEKPMSLAIADANEALDLARRHERVVQVGTQRRSEGGWKAVAKKLAARPMGHVSRISSGNFVNHARWARAYDDCKQQDVDWDAYLLNRPKVPFDPRLLRRWHLYKMCTNGLSGLWMSHFVDTVHMITGAKYPASAVAHGGIYVWKEDREHCDTFHALLSYPEGFLFDWAMGLANGAGGHFTVHGRFGTLDAETLTLSGAGGEKGKEIATEKIAAEPGEDHMANWLECVRLRRRPNADIEFGHQHSVATIIAAAALETGKRHVYDPQSRTMSPG